MYKVQDMSFDSITALIVWVWATHKITWEGDEYPELLPEDAKQAACVEINRVLEEC